MLPLPFHGYHPDAGDHVALVEVEPSTDREYFLLRVARGPTKATLRQTSILGPYPEEEIARHFTDTVNDLRAEGYWPGGVPALLAALDDAASAVRARAALRLGWRQIPEAVDKLLALLPSAVDDVCSIIDALGMIGEARAAPALREYAERKLLSRRRSAVEALRRIDDQEGMQHARQRALERLPEPIRAVFDGNETGHIGQMASALAATFPELEPQQQALTLDSLYELATPPAVTAVRQLVPSLVFSQPYVWRAVKSVFKRSMLRHDYVTFGLLAWHIETQLPAGVVAQVKSGYDGQTRSTSIFGKNTRHYLRRASWRYLQDLAKYRPVKYALAAAEVLIHFTSDYVEEQEWHRCYLLHRILFDGGNRFVFDGRSMSFRLRDYRKRSAPAGVREEAFPHLWDDQPRAYLRLLAAARLSEVHEFAVNAVRARHVQLLRQADHGEILAMLGAPYQETVNLALGELDRRFNPDDPDWSLLRRLLDDERSEARTLGQRWLRLTGHLWLGNVDRIIDFLGIRQPNLRALVVELTTGALHKNGDLRKALAARLVTILRAPQIEDGDRAGFAAVVREALSDEFSMLVGVEELAGWIAEGSPAVKVMASELLKRRDDAVAALGLERLSLMAQHDIVSVRAAAISLIESAAAQLRGNPAILFILVESEWEDTRNAAFQMLRERIDFAALGLDGLMGLLDSNRVDVQDLGKELARKHLQDVPAGDLVERLLQHPHPNMRPFALDLASEYLPQSDVAAPNVKSFCRAALLDLWPNRKVKRQAIALLEARGVEGRQQAETAAAILGDLIRLQGKSDFERALEALVRIKLAHPDLAMTVEVAEITKSAPRP